MMPDRKFKSSLDLVASLDALLIAASRGHDVERGVEDAVMALQSLAVIDMEDAIATLAFAERFRRRALECAISGEPVDPALLAAVGESLEKVLIFLQGAAGVRFPAVRVN